MVQSGRKAGRSNLQEGGGGRHCPCRCSVIVAALSWLYLTACAFFCLNVLRPPWLPHFLSVPLPSPSSLRGCVRTTLRLITAFTDAAVSGPYQPRQAALLWLGKLLGVG